MNESNEVERTQHRERKETREESLIIGQSVELSKPFNGDVRQRERREKEKKEKKEGLCLFVVAPGELFVSSLVKHIKMETVSTSIKKKHNVGRVQNLQRWPSTKENHPKRQ